MHKDRAQFKHNFRLKIPFDFYSLKRVNLLKILNDGINIRKLQGRNNPNKLTIAIAVDC